MTTRCDAVDHLDPQLGWVRRCCKCKIPKPHADFNKHHKDQRGRQRVCRECESKRAPRKRGPRPAEQFKAKYARHRDEITASSRTHYRTVRGRFLTLISAARTRAKKRDLLHNLDIAWALDLWDRQKGCCAITGIPLEIDTPLRTRSKYLSPFAPSLDRIVCSGGYTKDNTRIVCVAVNLALNNFGEDVFHRMLEGFAAKQAGVDPQRASLQGRPRRVKGMPVEKPIIGDALEELANAKVGDTLVVQAQHRRIPAVVESLQAEVDRLREGVERLIYFEHEDAADLRQALRNLLSPWN